MPLAQYPLILAGQDYTASLIQSFSPWTAWKAADTPRASDVTIAADPDLSIPTLANATYVVDGYLNFEGGTAGSSDLQWGLTSNGTLRYKVSGAGTGGTTVIGATDQGSGTVILGTNGAGNLRGADFHGMLIAGSSAGSLTLNWAQNTSNGTPTIMHANSWMSVRRVA